MTEQPDTTTMSGAQFQRHVGTDPVKWAEAFMQAQAHDGLARDDAIALLARWLRDYAEARVAEEVGRVTAAITQPCPP